MAINGRGSRRIVVGGSAYRWTIRPRPSYSQGNGWTPLRFAVELEAGSGSVLLVEVDGPRPDSWMILGGAPIVTPSLVASAIQSGIAQGWCPKLKGKPHVLQAQASRHTSF